jgi:ribonuclease/clavin/mitogillin
VNIGYRSTNFWVVSAGRSRLLIDLGWPGRSAEMLHTLERAGIPFAEIRYGFATHYHIDHAGAAQDLKARGMTLLVFEQQVAAIPAMKRYIKPSDHYTEIVAGGNVVMRCDESRALLAQIGIAGEVVPTPGHSDDSVSLVLDTGECFTGDLTPETMLGAEDALVVAASWARLRALGARTVYGGHVRPYEMPAPMTVPPPAPTEMDRG